MRVRHARGPHPLPNLLPSRVRFRFVVPQASMSTGDEGCTRSTWVLMEMVDILDTTVASYARDSVSFFAEEAAGMSEGGASVRPEIAAEAALAWVGRLWRYSVLCRVASW